MCQPQQLSADSSSNILMVGLPMNDDIICGRGRGAWTNPGNLKFKKVIEDNLQRYSDARRRKEKSLVIDYVLNTMVYGGARFVKQERKVWYHISKKEAREKTAHAIRDFHSRWKKSNESKGEEKKAGMFVPQPDWSNFQGSSPVTVRRAFSEPTTSLSRKIQLLQDTLAKEENTSKIPRSKSNSDQSTISDLSTIDLTASCHFAVAPSLLQSWPEKSPNESSPELEPPQSREADDSLTTNLLQRFCGDQSGDELGKAESQPCLLLDPATKCLDNAPDFC
jgi:hypothetical protein